MSVSVSQHASSVDPPPLPDALKKATDVEVLRQAFVAVRHAAFDKAAACFREVYQRDPDNPFAAIELAKAYFQMFEADAAEKLLQQVVAQAGKDVALLIRAGDAYETARRDQQAEECFLKALRQAPLDPGVSARLIWFYEIKGMLSKAKAALARAKEKNIRGPLLSLSRAMIATRSGDPQSTIPGLEAALAKLPPEDGRAIRGRYQLADVLTKSTREQQSIVELKRAKQVQEQQPEVAAYRELNQHMLAQMDQMRIGQLADGTRAWPRDVAAMPNRPLVFLLGYPRSGTTLLEQIIESHPAVRSMEETDVFEYAVRLAWPDCGNTDDCWRSLVATSPEAVSRTHELYFQYMERLGATTDPGTVLIDKNPSLTIRVHWVSRMFPDAKLLFMVRDPRDICLSAFQQNLGLTAFNVNWLRWEDTVKHCAAVLHNWVQLRNHLPNPIQEVRYEDLVDDLPAIGRKVMEFLGLDWQDAQQDFVSHARSKTVYSPSAYQVREGLNQKARGKWRKFGMDYSAGGEALSAVLAEYGYPEQSTR